MSSPGSSPEPSLGGPLLEVRGLERRFRSRLPGPKRRALAGIDLDLEAGESLGLLGPNGSGKSTLLRLLAGLERPDGGSIRIRGRGPCERITRRRVGYLSDDFPFPAELPAAPVLELCAALFGLSRRARRDTASRWLERVGLAEARREPLGHFSLGMKRRFSLAVAFQHDPELCLLDEPTAGLDAEGYLVLDELLAEARARGAGLVLATHVPGDLVANCRAGLVLFRGRVARRGPVAELPGSSAALASLYRELAAQGPGHP